jgi:hypothetical protein
MADDYTDGRITIGHVPPAQQAEILAVDDKFNQRLSANHRITESTAKIFDACVTEPITSGKVTPAESDCVAGFFRGQLEASRVMMNRQGVGEAVEDMLYGDGMGGGKEKEKDKWWSFGGK